MSTGPPQAPTNSYPKNGVQYPVGRTQVTLSWDYAPHAANYAVRVEDLTDPNARFAGNNCPDNAGDYVCRNNITTNQYAIPVVSGHAYRWTVQACNAAGWSLPVGGIFNVGNVEAGLIQSISAPRTLEPGAQAE